MSPTEDCVEYLLPRGSVIGTLSHIDQSINQIQKPLTNDQKRGKIITELKIQNNELLSATQKKELENLVSKYLDVFSAYKFNIGETDILEAEINLTDGTPVAEPLRRPPIHLLPHVKEGIEQLLKYNVIEPSQSP